MATQPSIKFGSVSYQDMLNFFHNTANTLYQYRASEWTAPNLDDEAFAQARRSDLESGVYGTSAAATTTDQYGRSIWNPDYVEKVLTPKPAGYASDVFGVFSKPQGYYSGTDEAIITRDKPYYTNKWGAWISTSAGLRDGSELGITLAPGQAYNFQTKQYSDTRLHPDTARLLNTATNVRSIKEQGLVGGMQTTTRQGQSAMAAFDQLYWGSTLAEETSRSTPISTMMQAKEVGYNIDGNRTLLGTDVKKPTVKKSTVRALT